MEATKLQEGVLCKLKVGRWDASAKLPKEKISSDMPREIIRAMQDLVEDRSLLKDLATVRRSAKGELIRHSIPFPVDGVWFVPKEQIEYLDGRFAQLKKDNDERLDALLENYSQLKGDMKRKYPKYYRPEKYPSEKRLREKFYFDWQFFDISLPGKSGVLSPKVYKREQQKFAGMIKEMEEMTMNLVATRLFKRINKLKTQCTNGKINAGTVSSIDRFLAKWDELWSGYIDETKMRHIMSQLKAQMKKVDSDTLKDSEGLREEVGKKMDRLINKIKAIPDVNLKRKLDV